MQRLSQSFTTKVKSISLDWSVFVLLTVGLTLGSPLKAQADSPETAPPQLKDTLSQIDRFANGKDVEGLLEFYSANFANSDGLSRDVMGEALLQLWQRYPVLNYRTELTDWQQEGNAIVAETVTYITSNQQDASKTKFESTLRSRQRFENQKIVYSTILAERSQITSGANPPKVTVKLPEQVRIGQRFNFDAIVQEPLGDDLLLGVAIEESVRSQRYTNPTEVDLESLAAGGIFKIGRAPLLPEDRWISAILIRGDGMIMITRRLHVVE
ncbi:MAG: nuclear transport factor 2 family protein [Moorea sp. SIO1G6]|nr:nuclear transport factor 2 family protein [Moorena sp. SIO3A5]NEQ15031.1 nuclear transport factor 2 family protein [Moorena sp. SIO3E2]NER89006.1 nuclear transport factor 2 family protein [Moorena sp. SIO3A2]NES45077.1 nuclear transport factor 2 family protein [Moorena sp. SIO2C4]NET67040.1 nuclear transport factor 2 family protein [Moorena sp. SIO1G6]